MILLLLFNIIPLIASLVISTFDVSMTLNDARFVGLGNFVEAFHDSRFWNSMWVTIKWTLVAVSYTHLMNIRKNMTAKWNFTCRCLKMIN